MTRQRDSDDELREQPAVIGQPAPAPLSHQRALMEDAMSRLDRDTIDQVRQRTPIEQVAGEYTRLRRSGAGWRGRCPLHDERTPSFVVTPGKGWRCFGACDTGGDVIDLVQRVERVPFREAVRRLGVRAGVILRD